MAGLRRAKREIRKVDGMLEPNNKTIHTILQPHEEVKLSCHVFPAVNGKVFSL